MARAPLTAAMASSALWRHIEVESDQNLISKYGREKDEVFYGANQLKNIVGEWFDDIPAGALGVFTYFMRLEQRLKQLMAGARKFNLSDEKARLDRNDIVALTRAASEITGIPFIMDHEREKIELILDRAGG